MDEDGNTLLCLVVVHSHSQVVYTLLRYGWSNPELTNKQDLIGYKMTLQVYNMQMNIFGKLKKNCEAMTLSLYYLRTYSKNKACFNFLYNIVIH